MTASPTSWKHCMNRGTDLRLGLGVLLLFAGTLGQAQTEVPDTTTAHWRNGALEVVTAEGANWSHPIAFTALGKSPTYRKRFAASTVTVQENRGPEGPSRTAQAQFKGQTWLRWGEGTAPLVLDSAGGWPYRLVADTPAGAKPPQYHWINADVSQRLVATPNRVQNIHTPHATWCTWFAVGGTQEARSNLADGRVPTIRWMLWKRPKNAARCSSMSSNLSKRMLE
jgi:hypothetical protein